MNRTPLRLLILAPLLAATCRLPATTLDFEGFAPAGGIHPATGTTTMGDFFLATPHGYIFDSVQAAWGGIYQQNGTDWYLHDTSQPFRIGRHDGGAFTLQGLDASDYSRRDGANAVQIAVTGRYLAGGTISTTLTTDTVNGFETFAFGAGWTNLDLVTFTTSYGPGGNSDWVIFDNIQLGGSVPVPDRGRTGLLVLAAIAALAGSARPPRRLPTAA